MRSGDRGRWMAGHLRGTKVQDKRINDEPDSLEGCVERSDFCAWDI